MANKRKDGSWRVVGTQLGMVKVAPVPADRLAELQAAGNPIVVSYGMGRDSTAMLVGLAQNGIRPDLILFADVAGGTGDWGEKRRTMAYLETMNTWLRSVGFPEVTVVTYQTTEKSRTDDRTGQPYRSLYGQCWATGHLPSFAYGGKGGGQANATCSIKWKQQAQERYTERWGPAIEAFDNGRKVVKLIGYDCQEMHRGSRCRAYEPEVFEWSYPLRDWGWDRTRQAQEIEAAGLPVPPKSSCAFCPAMRPAEFRELADTEPATFLAVIALEDRACRSEAGKCKGDGLWMHKRQADDQGVRSDRKDGRWTSVRAWAETTGVLETAERRVVVDSDQLELMA
jgi:hypothetical protein